MLNKINIKLGTPFWFVVLLSIASIAIAFYLDYQGIISNDQGGRFVEDVSVQSLIIGIGFFTSLLILVKIFGFISITTKNTLSRKEIKKQLKYQDYLVDLITSHEVEDIFSTKRVMNNFLSKEDFYDKNNRKILLNEIKAIHKVLEGNKKEKIRKLYLSLGYIEDVKDKLLSVNWESRVEALLEINTFNLELYHHMVEKFLRDKNDNVRKVALEICIQLSEEPLSLLSKIPYELNRWEKHLFAKTISSLPISLIPDLSVYFSHRQDHNQFIDELRSQFNQIDKTTKSKLHAI